MTHRALGIDLASASWADNGSALIELDADQMGFASVTPGAIAWPSSPLTPAAMADAIDAFARSRGVGAVALDGPAGWRDPETPAELPGVGRRSEYEAHTQGKTGVYPQTYPGTQRAWIEHCITVFDALLEKPGVVIAREPGEAPPAGGYLLLECFPTSTWRMSGLAPLSGKGKKPKLAPYIEALSRAFGLPAFSTSSHDDLQGVVAALAATGALGGPVQPFVHGVPCRSVVHADGQSRRVEGQIWDAQPTGLIINFAPDADLPRLPLPAASARVTSGILAEVNRTGNRGAMCIALRGTPRGRKAARKKVALQVREAEYVLVVGDTHAAWHSHQTAETEEDFDLLFALLAEHPGVYVEIDEVRTL